MASFSPYVRPHLVPLEVYEFMAQIREQTTFPAMIAVDECAGCVRNLLREPRTARVPRAQGSQHLQLQLPVLD